MTRNRSKRVTSPAGMMAAAVAVLALGACDDSAGPPQAERYQLSVVNDATLPAQHPETNFLQVVSGELALYQDGTAEETVVIRCRPDLPPGSDCTVTAERTTRVGSYSIAEGWVRFDERSHQAVFEEGRVTVEYGPPPSHGVFFRSTFVFAR